LRIRVFSKIILISISTGKLLIGSYLFTPVIKMISAALRFYNKQVANQLLIIIHYVFQVIFKQQAGCIILRINIYNLKITAGFSTNYCQPGSKRETKSLAELLPGDHSFLEWRPLLQA